jgi:hypothetical protein
MIGMLGASSRRGVFAGFGVFVACCLLLQGVSAATEDFDNSVQNNAPEFLDASALEILVGKADSVEPKKPKPSSSARDDNKIEQIQALLPDVETTGIGGFDENLEWTDFEELNAGDTHVETDEEGLFEEGSAPQNSGETSGAPQQDPNSKGDKQGNL